MANPAMNLQRQENVISLRERLHFRMYFASAARAPKKSPWTRLRLTKLSPVSSSTPGVIFSTKTKGSWKKEKSSTPTEIGILGHHGFRPSHNLLAHGLPTERVPGRYAVAKKSPHAPPIAGRASSHFEAKSAKQLAARSVIT